MSVSDLFNLPNEYRCFLISGVEEEAKEAFLGGKICDSTLDRTDYPKLYERRWKKHAPESVKDLSSYLQAIVGNKTGRLQTIMESVAKPNLFLTNDPNLALRYEDLLHGLEDLYLSYSAYILLRLPVPVGLEEEHKSCESKALDKFSENEAIIIEGPSGNETPLNDQAIELIGDLLDRVRSKEKQSVDLSLKNLSLTDEQFAKLLAKIDLNLHSTLDLSGNRLTSKSAELLAKTLEEKKVFGMVLTLDQNLIGETGVMAFLPLMQKGCNITLTVKGIGVSEDFMSRLRGEVKKSKSFSFVYYQ